MGEWLFWLWVLYVLGWALPALGAALAYRQGRRTLRRMVAEKATADRLSAEWGRRRDPLQAAGRWDEVNALNDEMADRYKAEGLVPDNIGSTDLSGRRTVIVVLSLVFERNGWNLAIVLAGPLLSTVASLLALYPPS